MDMSPCLADGLKLVKLATELDAAGSHREAVALYTRACERFEQALQEESNESRSAVLRRKIAEYRSRVSEISAPSPSIGAIGTALGMGAASATDATAGAAGVQAHASTGSGGRTGVESLAGLVSPPTELPSIEDGAAAHPSGDGSVVLLPNIAGSDDDEPAAVSELDEEIEGEFTEIGYGAGGAGAEAQAPPAPSPYGAVPAHVVESMAGAGLAPAASEMVEEVEVNPGARVTYEDMGIQPHLYKGPRFDWHPQKNAKMKMTFPDMPKKEECAEWFSCAQDSLLSQGTFFIAQHYFAFAGGISSKQTIMYIADVVSVTRVQGMLSTSLIIATKLATYEFLGFRDIDYAERLINYCWQNQHIPLMPRDVLSTMVPALDTAFHRVFTAVPAHERLCARFQCEIEEFETVVYLTKSFFCLHREVDGLQDMIPLQFLTVIRRAPGSFMRSCIQVVTMSKKVYVMSFKSERDDCFVRLSYLWQRYNTRPVVFGRTLRELVSREDVAEDGRVPGPVHALVEIIRNTDVCTSAIFDDSLRPEQVLDYRSRIDEGTPVPSLQLNAQEAATLLKVFLRHLPTPLLTPQIISQYELMKDMPVGVEKTHALRGLLGSFGLHEKNLMEFLLELLSDLCANSRGLVTALDVSERLAPSMVGGGTEQKELGTDAAHAVAMGVHCLYALVVSHADMQTLL